MIGNPRSLSNESHESVGDHKAEAVSGPFSGALAVALLLLLSNYTTILLLYS